VRLTNDGGQPGVLHALTHYSMSSLFMGAAGPRGVAGRRGGVNRKSRLLAPADGLVLDAADAQADFLRAYRAWRAGGAAPARAQAGGWRLPQSAWVPQQQ
jgi:hypothetical protein